ncbi:MAG: PD-(D/E)XK nuclease family protein, partial [Dehalococcoidia bacterium]
PSIVVALGGGQEVAFRGRLDRVDRAPDGSRMLVVDYKSGSAARFPRIDRDPVQRGQLLQLPVYSLAVKAVYGDVPVGAYYWFITEASDFKRLGYLVSEDQLVPFRSALAVIVQGIRGGLFPARPGSPVLNGFENCRFCPYDRVCPRDRSRRWHRKKEAPELRGYVELAEPEA